VREKERKRDVEKARAFMLLNFLLFKKRTKGAFVSHWTFFKDVKSF